MHLSVGNFLASTIAVSFASLILGPVDLVSHFIPPHHRGALLYFIRPVDAFRPLFFPLGLRTIVAIIEAPDSTTDKILLLQFRVLLHQYGNC